MQHHISLDQLGAHGQPMVDAVQACVHCGFCLPACPTYQVLGNESDSPRGRILSMRRVLEGEIDLSEVENSLDRCLGCLGCETSCPSGVPYRNLMLPFRALAKKTRSRTLIDRIKHALVMGTLPYPNRFRLAAKTGRLIAPFKRFIPKTLHPMVDLLPGRLPKPWPIPAYTPAVGKQRGRVALLAGCAQQALAPQINRATIAVLAQNGVEVLVPPGQGCCGALGWHHGDGDHARRLARVNMRVFPHDVDAILTNAAGCGSGMHEYGMMFLGLPEAPMAEAFSKRVTDVSQYLHDLGIIKPPALSGPHRVAYHDACHLNHAQRVYSAPRALLQSIDGLQLVEITDSQTCCGSAGTYNLDHPETAHALGQKKAQHITETQCDWVATGNIGCIVQIQTHLKNRPPHGLSAAPNVLHTMEILAAAYANNDDNSDNDETKTV